MAYIKQKIKLCIALHFRYDYSDVLLKVKFGVLYV